MNVNGEAFLLLNGGMNFLALLLCARALHLHLPLGRGMLAAALGSGYAAMAWALCGPWARGIPALALSGCAMTAIAFGQRALWALPGLGAAGLFLGGLCDFLLRMGCGPAAAITLCALAALLLSLALPGGVRGGGRFTLEIVWQGKTARIPAFRDSGNHLRDPIRALPVIVTPSALLAGLLPPHTNPRDLATLPDGWYLVRAKTVSGEATLMCFAPDKTALRRGGRWYPIRAAVAISPLAASRALLPEAIFLQEERIHASL